MAKKTTWQTLLTPTRFKESSIDKKISFDVRNPFENDYTRIILSPHFRRLRDKTQVFPYDDGDFVRTRLTHSLEVSAFGRSLGLSLERYLIQSGEITDELIGHVSSLLATAGLVHDIGNPPFGHFGEECIQDFYNTEGKKFIENLKEDEKTDFLNFDGNAQTFRVLRKLGPPHDYYSYNLTFPVLAATIKYPFSSQSGNKNDPKHISKKKFGYFQSESEDFLKISKTLKMFEKRHPLVFLLEAADDIAYSVSDIEDGCKKGIITEEILRNEIKATLSEDKSKKTIAWLDATKKELPKNHPNSFHILIGKFRIKCQTELIRAAYITFTKNLKGILNGSFDKDILENSSEADLRNLMKKLGRINFNHSSVLKKEITGKKVLKFHLENFGNAIFSEKRNVPRTYEGKLYSLLSSNHRYLNEQYEGYDSASYRNLLLLNDFVSGMTDNYAIRLYKELSGI